ncbi:MAG: hypothetical protein K6B14_02050 [Lachnospiraceae bacterium]|nr:hypothetical protein [Lachnospiraceae bacterium]
MKQKNDQKESLLKLFYYILSVAAGIIIINNVFMSGVTYVTKKDFFLPAIETMAIALLLIFALVHNRFSFFKPHIPIPVILVVFFAYQILVSKSIMFLTATWDAGTVLDNVILIERGLYDVAYMDYFSHYTYNDGIFLLEYCLAVILDNMGILTQYNMILAMIVLQSAANTAVAWLVYDVLKRLHDRQIGYLGLWVYILWFGLIGWQSVVYNDMTSIIFPIGAFDLYLRRDSSRWDYPKWIGIFVLVFMGYKIKPTVLIILIAIGMSEGFRFLIQRDELKEHGYEILSTLLSAVAVFALVSSIFAATLDATPLKINEELNTGPLHMLMMGMNDANDGCFVYTDVTYSFSYETKQERTQAQLLRIKSRFENYTPQRFLSFISKKALVVFNDGSFAWGEEAGFYDRKYTHGPLSDFFKNIYYNEGSVFPWKLNIWQLLWYMTLILLFLVSRLKYDKNTLVLALAVTGIFVFDMLFEARARYLIVYVPVIMILAIHGLSSMIEERRLSDHGC